MKTLTCGLIAGRHPMPVETYIFDSIDNVLDFTAIRKGVAAFLDANCDIYAGSGAGLNQAGYVDLEVWRSDVELVVYVTGLTAVTAELVRQCAMSGICLTLMHYDRDTDGYVPQPLFAWCDF